MKLKGCAARLAPCMAAAALLISGCINSPVIGVAKDYHELFQGSVSTNPLSGRAYLELRSLVSNARCAGPASVVYFSQTETGGAALVCDDGRKLTLSLTRTDTGRRAVGKDQYGNEFIFDFGLSDDEAARRLSVYVRQSTERARPQGQAAPDGKIW